MTCVNMKKWVCNSKTMIVVDCHDECTGKEEASQQRVVIVIDSTLPPPTAKLDITTQRNDLWTRVTTLLTTPLASCTSEEVKVIQEKINNCGGTWRRGGDNCAITVTLKDTNEGLACTRSHPREFRVTVWWSLRCPVPNKACCSAAARSKKTKTCSQGSLDYESPHRKKKNTKRQQ